MASHPARTRGRQNASEVKAEPIGLKRTGLLSLRGCHGLAAPMVAFAQSAGKPIVISVIPVAHWPGDISVDEVIPVAAGRARTRKRWRRAELFNLSEVRFLGEKSARRRTRNSRTRISLIRWAAAERPARRLGDNASSRRQALCDVMHALARPRFRCLLARAGPWRV